MLAMPCHGRAVTHGWCLMFWLNSAARCNFSCAMPCSSSKTRCNVRCAAFTSVKAQSAPGLSCEDGSSELRHWRGLASCPNSPHSGAIIVNVDGWLSVQLDRLRHVHVVTVMFMGWGVALNICVE